MPAREPTTRFRMRAPSRGTDTSGEQKSTSALSTSQLGTAAYQEPAFDLSGRETIVSKDRRGKLPVAPLA